MFAGIQLLPPVPAQFFPYKVDTRELPPAPLSGCSAVARDGVGKVRGLRISQVRQVKHHAPGKLTELRDVRLHDGEC